MKQLRVAPKRTLLTSALLLALSQPLYAQTAPAAPVIAAIADDTGIRPHFSLEAFDDLDDDIRQAIARIQHSPFLPSKDRVRGFVYEVETGKLREVS